MVAEISNALEWRLIGPHRGGRVVAVAGDPAHRETFYFGACAGGVWKTTDGGAYWECVSDGFFNTAAIGAIAVSESDPERIYVGSGETAIRGNVSHGDGVYRSLDGGRTWKNVGLHDSRHIGRIRIHPTNPDLIYVAALGHVWGPNEERGVFRSQDGGETWERVLFKSEDAGAIDLSMVPTAPHVLYATIWQARRYPYRLESGGPESGIWRSFDGGDSWEEITRRPGLPTGTVGKIGIVASPAKPERVWALVEAEDGALFRSDDYGDTWVRLSESGELRRRSWYYMHIYADPQDADTVWILSGQCWRSIDGGHTFHEVPTTHGDNHDLWIDSRDSKRMIEGNDGGASVTFNGGETWSTLYNQPTAQFYHVTADDQIPYRVYGSQQDNTAIRLPSMSFDGVITQQEWVEPGGGESGYIAVQPNEPHLVFAGAVGMGPGPGKLISYDPRTRQRRDISVWPEDSGYGAGAESDRYRFQWTFPVQISPHDPDVLYVCSNHVHRSVDAGTSWETISPDLSHNDPDKLRPSGGPISLDNTGAEIYCTIFAFAESPQEAGTFWAGTDDGRIHISRDGGAGAGERVWQEITPPASLLPEWALISIIEPSPHDAATAYVAATRYKLDDTRPYLLKTDDYGQSWQSITNGIPKDEFTRVIREDPNQQGLVYAGTETGLYISFDDGTEWERFQLNLPVAPIHDLMIKGTDLIAATHGRSFWILDDLTPLYSHESLTESQGPVLLAPRPAHRFRFYKMLGTSAWSPEASSFANYALLWMAGPGTAAFRLEETPDGRTTESFLDAGKNPPEGVLIHYYLKDRPHGEVLLDILTDDGAPVRTISSTGGQASGPRLPVEPGLNRFVWDMGHTPPDHLDGSRPGPVFRRSPYAPKALPGRYKAALTFDDGVNLVQEFEILKDPRLPVSDAELAAQFEFLGQVSDKVSLVHRTLNHSQRLRTQLEGWEARLESSEADEALRQLRELTQNLLEIEGALTDRTSGRAFLDGGKNQLREKLITLFNVSDNADAPPTRQAQAVFAELSPRVDEQIQKLDSLLETDFFDLNARIAEAGIPAIDVS